MDLSAPSVPHLLSAWSFDPAVVLAVVAAGALYALGVVRVGNRYPGAPWPVARTISFLGGLGAIVLALQSPIDTYAEVFLWIHMIQHILLTFLAAPLLLMGAPITIALRASTPATRRTVLLPVLHSLPVRLLSHPLSAWLLFAAVMVGTHFSPLYESALEHPWIHDGEHLLFLGSGLLFWWPVIGLDPSRWRMPHPLRLLYVFVAGPVNTFTALAIYSANRVLYPHYAAVRRSFGPSPLADQRWGGALMWITGDVILLLAVVLTAAAWMRHEQVATARLDRRLDAERAASPEEWLAPQ